MLQSKSSSGKSGCVYKDAFKRNDSLYPLAFSLLILTGDWKLGEKAEDCNTVCKTIGKDCDPLKASKLSGSKLAEIISAFNQTCDTIIECGSAATYTITKSQK